MAMLYEGRVRTVGTVDEVRESTDPIVRQFIDGRPSLDADDVVVHASGGTMPDEDDA